MKRRFQLACLNNRTSGPTAQKARQGRPLCGIHARHHGAFSRGLVQAQGLLSQKGPRGAPSYYGAITVLLFAHLHQTPKSLSHLEAPVGIEPTNSRFAGVLVASRRVAPLSSCCRDITQRKGQVAPCRALSHGFVALYVHRYVLRCVWVGIGAGDA